MGVVVRQTCGVPQMIAEISLKPGESEEKLRFYAAKVLKIKEKDIGGLRVLKKSIDARKKPNVIINYRVSVWKKGEKPDLPPVYAPKSSGERKSKRPVVVGFGPAGMFAALVMSEAGLKPIVLERGGCVDERVKKIDEFWGGGALDPETNVQFGEGGAGTFSDGKLTTGTKDERISYVLSRLAGFGAQEHILWDSKPHIGTDRLREVVKNLREHIISLGAEVRFNTKMTALRVENGRVTGVQLSGGEVIDCDAVVLAIGHSARDTVEYLESISVPMEPKAFSMGVRIEHRQRSVDFAQYGFIPERHELPPADYKLSVSFPEGDSAYTFCMCPGGYVVAAASEENRVCTNGMSYSLRAGENANAALLVTLTPDKFPYPGVLGGLRWQREIESAAFKAGGGNYCAPAQRVGDFLKDKPSAGAGSVRPTYRPGVKWCDLRDCLPESITKTLKKSIPALARKLKGFDEADAVLTAAETRSSSPVRILRGADFESEVRGLYPCGEGAGYAGGIVSAAVDGVRVAERLI